MSNARTTTCLIAAMVATSLMIATPAAAEEPLYDGLQELFDDEARTAMADGDYVRAWYFFWRLLKINPDDARALREAARTAQALGNFRYAERALARVEALRRGVSDPELYYLRGEALLALGRKDEADREFSRAEFWLPRGPLDRSGSMWLARIYALRGDLPSATATYQRWLPEDDTSADYGEVITAMAEAHLINKDRSGAERLLRQLLVVQPEHLRGRELLAWVLETRGKIDEELEVRAQLASRKGADQGGRTLRYARTLERAYEYDRALVTYRQAAKLGIEKLDPDIQRMRYRMSPELAAGLVTRDDPTGTTTGWLAGANLPLGSQLRFGLTASQDAAQVREIPGGIPQGGDVSLFTISGLGTLSDRRGDVFGAGATVYWGGGLDGVRAGVTAGARSRPARVQAQLSGELAMPWRESAGTMREGGVADGLAADVFARPFTDKLVWVLSGRARRLALAPVGAVDAPHARQLVGAAGVDWVAYTRPERVARGEILDDAMLWPSTLSTSLVFSYRRYELTSNDPFGPRLVLVERSSIDELSGIARYVFGARGILAAEVGGGAGYDWHRDVRQWRAAGSLLLSATASSRLKLAYDAASESGTGLVGRRHTGWLTLHVDL